VLDSVPDARYGPWEAGDSVAVGVWNVAGGSGYLTEFLKAELDLDWSREAARPSHHFVLLFQEVFRRSGDIPTSPPSPAIPPRIKEPERPGDRPDVVSVAQRCGLAFIYVPATRNGVEEYDGMREDKGNAIVTTLPLSDFIAIELPMVAQRRVSVAATIRGPEGDSLRVVSVHLNNFPSPWRFVTTGGMTRVQQALSVTDALQRVERERGGTSDEAGGYAVSTVAAGDFNTWSAHETALRQLRDHFPDSPPYQGKATRTGFATDHLLFRSSTVPGARSGRIIEGSYRRIDNPYYSDHYPLMAWFSWESN
jgi:endonuclease/exonuclease/phosphatase family metal-dependent hydrolase